MANSFSYKDQQFNVGDRLLIHQNIVEENKTRVQIFDGIVIAVKGRGDNCSFTIRRIASNNIGVERTFPVQSPVIKQIEVKSRGSVRRSKLYYLRNRTGRQAMRVKEKKTIVASKSTSKQKPTPSQKSHAPQS